MARGTPCRSRRIGFRPHLERSNGGGKEVAAQLARQLADPRPKDASVTQQLDSYRNIAPRWSDWNEVRTMCGEISVQMFEEEV